MGRTQIHVSVDRHDALRVRKIQDSLNGELLHAIETEEALNTTKIGDHHVKLLIFKIGLKALAPNNHLPNLPTFKKLCKENGVDI